MVATVREEGNFMKVQFSVISLQFEEKR